MNIAKGHQYYMLHVHEGLGHSRLNELASKGSNIMLERCQVRACKCLSVSMNDLIAVWNIVWMTNDSLSYLRVALRSLTDCYC